MKNLRHEWVAGSYKIKYQIGQRISFKTDNDTEIRTGTVSHFRYTPPHGPGNQDFDFYIEVIGDDKFSVESVALDEILEVL